MLDTQAHSSYPELWFSRFRETFLGFQGPRHWFGWGMVVLLFSNPSDLPAQLQITEFLYDTRSAEPDWEWFELRNTSTAAVDLDGYFLDDRSTAAGRTFSNISALVGDVEVNTIVPAGGSAVVYNGSALEFDEARFRSAWSLNDDVPLIGVNGWQSLNNGGDGDAFGLWDSFESYQLDLANIDEDDDVEVAGFDNAIVSLDYGQEGFARSGTGNSLQWNGVGDFQDPQNWFASSLDTASESLPTTLEGLAINDTRDIGSPGAFTGFTDGGTGLAITEIMYNPASDEPAWEWLELFNGTETAIDFMDTPYYVDDLAGEDLSDANLTSGSIAPGGLAILHPAGTSLDDLTAAWGSQNFIEVSSWPSLNNGGDMIALWSDADEYAADGEAAGDRENFGAVVSVTYDDGSDDWPDVGQGNSISIADLAENGSLGTNWILSTDGDGESFFASPVIASQPDHTGGDFGTPGVFGASPLPTSDLNGDGLVNASDAALICDRAGNDVDAFLQEIGVIPGDLDLNGSVEFADFLILSGSFGLVEGSHYGLGDADCENGVDFADFLVLSGNFGTSAASHVVPEPGFPAVAWSILCVLGGWRRFHGRSHSRRGGSLPKA